MRRAPTVDLVVGPQSYHRLPALLEQSARGERPVETEFPADDKFNFLKNPTREAMRARGVTAFLTIQEGCDKFCTFCVVPYTRGAEVSRPVGKIVEEARAPGRCRHSRDHGDRPERQRLSRRRHRTAAASRLRNCSSGSPKFPASTGCATPQAIRATSTTA